MGWGGEGGSSQAELQVDCAPGRGDSGEEGLATVSPDTRSWLR